MQITGKAHCFFEQSGTFKNEFKKLGIEAEDYDIQNNFNETDNVIDLFAEIETEYKQQTTNNKQQTTNNGIRPHRPMSRYYSCFLPLYLLRDFTDALLSTDLHK